MFTEVISSFSKYNVMKIKQIFSVIALISFFMGANAQPPKSKVKIVDTQNESTIVYGTTPSSSLSCQAADFPVYLDASLTQVNFNDLQKIIVHHEMPAKMDTNYIRVEMITKDGESEVYEMVKNTRFLGNTDKGSFSVKVKDVQTLEIVE